MADANKMQTETEAKASELSTKPKAQKPDAVTGAAPIPSSETSEKDIVLSDPALGIDADLENEKLNALGDKAGGGVGVSDIRDVLSPIEKQTVFLDRATKLYDLYLTFIQKMDGGVITPEEVAQLKEGKGDLIKDYPVEMVQYKLNKYNKHQALARVAVTTVLGDVFSTMKGSKGSVQTAGAEAFSAGIDNIQTQQDKVDAENRLLDQKNVILADKYYDNALQWAKDYNTIYTQNEQIKNNLVMDIVKQRVAENKNIMDSLEKAYRGTSTNAASVKSAEIKSDTDIKKATQTTEVERKKLQLEEQKAQTERYKLQLGILKATSKAKELAQGGVIDFETGMKNISVATSLGIDPSITIGSLNQKDMSDLRPISNHIAQQSDLQSEMVLATANDNFLGSNIRDKARKAINFFTVLNNAGVTIDSSASPVILDALKSDKDIPVNTDIVTGKVTSSDPRIKDLVKSGSIKTSISLKELTKVMNNYNRAIDIAASAKDMKTAVALKSELNNIIGGTLGSYVSAPGQIPKELEVKAGILKNQMLLSKFRGLLSSPEKFRFTSITPIEAATVPVEEK